MRVSQITDLVDVPKIDAISQLQLEKSTILVRKVFEKDKMVRKFIVWKTNKEGSGLYPDFVIYFLDYSKNRKEPFKRKTKINFLINRVDIIGPETELCNGCTIMTGCTNIGNLTI